MTTSLQDLIDAAGGPLAHLRSHKWNRRGPASLTPDRLIPQIPPEFSRWDLESDSWHTGVALFDQTHHMEGLRIWGPDAVRFLSGLACNNLAVTVPGRAHQMLLVTEQGHFIGEDILFHLEQDDFFIVGVPFALHWIQYHAERTDLDIEFETDDTRSPVYANGHGNERKYFRYQLQGPNAWALLEHLNAGPIDEVAFFHLTEVTIGGHRLRALRHAMAGAPGLEVFGPWELRDEVRGTILDEGTPYGLTLVGSAAYLAGGTEGGYLPWAVPGIYTDPALEAYRRWLPARHLEGWTRLSGSLALPSVEDYYMTPYEFGYGHLIRFDHDFIGREALLRQDPASARRKASIVWDVDDAADLFAEFLDPDGPRLRPLTLPMPLDRADVNYDAVRVGDRLVGSGHLTAYSQAERALFTLALLDGELRDGDEVVVHWGEAGGGHGDGVVVPDEIRPIRGTVSPAPLTRVAREDYVGRRTWRSR